VLKGPADNNYAPAQFNLAATLEKRAEASDRNDGLAEAIMVPEGRHKR